MLQKMGTHYVREIAQLFREVAVDTSFAGLKEKLVSVADQMEPLAPKNKASPGKKNLNRSLLTLPVAS